MIIFVPYELYLIILELIILWWLNRRTGWTRKRRSLGLVLVVCTSILLTMQMGLAYDLSSYEQGEIGYPSQSGGSIRPYDEEIELQPGETRVLGTLSNWNTVVYLGVKIVLLHNNATFYIMDENRREVNYTLGNTTWEDPFLLPYRYTCPFVIADWTANLHNPSETEPATVDLWIGTLWIEDEWYVVIRPILLWHTFPSIILPVLWGYTGLSLLSARLKKPAAPVQIANQSHDIGNTTGQQSQ